MKGKYYQIMFGIMKKMSIVLLSNIVNGSNHTKCVSLSMFNTIAGINESNILTKDIPCEC